MFFKAIIHTEFLKFSFKKLFFLSYITLGLINESNAISQLIINQNLDEESKISNISFITKAVKKTGASVVTIDTQRFVENKQFSRDSRIFLDPYFERFFGLQLPPENSPQIEPVSYTHLTLPTKRIV